MDRKHRVLETAGHSQVRTKLRRTQSADMGGIEVRINNRSDGSKENLIGVTVEFVLPQ